jgi:hypothetical protein
LDGDIYVIMNLQEQKHRIKEIMGLIFEDQQKELTLIKNKISSLKSVDEINNYFEELNEKYAPDSSKLVLIFPGYGQYTIAATAIFLAGINAHVFTSINDCIDVINNLVSKGKKYLQIYVGSHGGGHEGLLRTIDEEDDVSIFNGFSSSLAQLTIPNKTLILFSACGGANDISSGYILKKIAEETESYVYASEGNFNWVDNKSEGTLWMCPPNPKLHGKYATKEYNFCYKVSSAPFNFR